MKPDTVAAYIREHAAEFEGHTQMDGKAKVLDEVALELLDRKYPIPQPIQLVPDTEAINALLKELNESRKQAGELYQKLLQLTELNSELQLKAAQVPLLEGFIQDAKALAEEKGQEAAAARQEAAAATQRADQAERERDEARSELDRRDQAGPLARLFRHW